MQVSKLELALQGLLGVLVRSGQDAVNVVDHVDQISATVLGQTLVDRNKVLPLPESAYPSTKSKFHIRSSRLLRQARSRRGKPRRYRAGSPQSSQPEHRCMNHQPESKPFVVSCALTSL